MDSFSQESMEKEVGKEEIKKSEDLDIQFEEVLDIDAIQKKLEKMDFTLDEEPEEEEKLSLPAEDVKNELTPRVPFSPPKKSDSNAKKYVIYIDSDNVDYMEGLSLNDRREIINSILKEQNRLSEEEKQAQQTKKFFKHAMLACITFLVFFPLLFILVNKALSATISNYQQARDNFAKLYKEQGKIKMQSR